MARPLSLQVLIDGRRVESAPELGAPTPTFEPY